MVQSTETTEHILVKAARSGINVMEVKNRNKHTEPEIALTVSKVFWPHRQYHIICKSYKNIHHTAVYPAEATG